MLNLFKLELIKIFIFDNPFGRSIKISLNSLMNGGNTRMNIVEIMNVITNKTINNERNLGIFNPFCIWLHKLQTTLDITSEQIIRRRNSLKVQTIKRLIKTTPNLK